MAITFEVNAAAEEDDLKALKPIVLHRSLLPCSSFVVEEKDGCGGFPPS
jgi:hypothetical protein